jgi:hypothetical protein
VAYYYSFMLDTVPLGEGKPLLSQRSVFKDINESYSLRKVWRQRIGCCVQLSSRASSSSRSVHIHSVVVVIIIPVNLRGLSFYFLLLLRVHKFPLANS